MEIQEREFAQRLARAASVLPDRKREYILGYAEGVLAQRRPAACGQGQRVKSRPEGRNYPGQQKEVKTWK